MFSVARGHLVDLVDAQGGKVGQVVGRSFSSATCAIEMPRCWALAISLSSTSVMLTTQVTVITRSRPGSA